MNTNFNIHNFLLLRRVLKIFSKFEEQHSWNGKRSVRIEVKIKHNKNKNFIFLFNNHLYLLNSTFSDRERCVIFV